MLSRLPAFLPSTVVCCVLGMLISIVVDNALLEISLSRMFSILFGLSLLLLGSVIIWRVVSSDNEKPASRIRTATLAFSAVVVLAGVSCFLVEKDFIRGLPAAAKVPLYSLVGTALAFAMTFSIVELANQGVFSCACLGAGGGGHDKPVVGTPAQIYVILGSALLCGLVFGVVFGALDVEDDTRAHTKLQKDHDWTVPFGAVVGAAVGFANHYLRAKDEYQFDPLSNRSEGI
jgi:hypothetical protein